MKIFKRTGRPQPTKLQKRIATIGTTDLVIYAETTLATIGRNLAGSGRLTPERVAEAGLAADVVVVIVDELKKRVSDD